MADKVLQGIILAAMSTIQQEDVVIPGQLLETAVILHGKVKRLIQSDLIPDSPFLTHIS